MRQRPTNILALKPYVPFISQTSAIAIFSTLSGFPNILILFSGFNNRKGKSLTTVFLKTLKILAVVVLHTAIIAYKLKAWALVSYWILENVNLFSSRSDFISYYNAGFCFRKKQRVKGDRLKRTACGSFTFSGWFGPSIS